MCNAQIGRRGFAAPWHQFAVRLIAIAAVALSFSSCELFDDPETEDMASQVTGKTIMFLDDFYSQYYEQYATGAVITDVSTPPGGSPKTLTVTVVEYSTDTTGYSYSYSEQAVFDDWSGDGSNPYMNLTGTVTFGFSSADYSRILTGTLRVADADDNSINKITFDLSLDSNYQATGTVAADGTTFTWDAFSIATY